MAKTNGAAPIWQRWLAIAVGVFVGLYVLGSVMGSDKTAAPEGAGEEQPEFFEMPQPDHFAMVVPAGASPDLFEGMAKEHCAERTFCKVFGWTEKGRAARALPMSDRELEALAFSYQINRSGDFEQVIWDCTRFPQPNPINCISD